MCMYRLFEVGGETSLEFFCQKSDAAMFAFGSHTKKRPNNLTIGRMFDGHLYDAVRAESSLPSAGPNLRC